MDDSTETVDNLILDLLEWVGRKARTYEETMDAWRTSCPKLPVWEDTNNGCPVEMSLADGRSLIQVAPAGIAMLKENRPQVYHELRLRGAQASGPAGSRLRPLNP
jgi:D-3-phosphoglycerate dehydrogenase / 2-oxoglutarate reductase